MSNNNNNDDNNNHNNNDDDNNNNNNNNSNDVTMRVIKNAKSKFFVTWLVTETNGLAQKKKKSVFYFLLKVPNLNLY